MNYSVMARCSFTLLSDWEHNQLVPAIQFISHRDEALGTPGQLGVGQYPWQARSSQAKKSFPFFKKQQSIRSPLVFQPIWVHFIKKKQLSLESAKHRRSYLQQHQSVLPCNCGSKWCSYMHLQNSWIALFAFFPTDSRKIERFSGNAN